MSQLFIELYLDEDVNILIAELLRGRGFTAITTRDAQQLQNSDAAQLAYAVSQQKTLLTHNRADFEKLAHAHPQSGNRRRDEKPSSLYLIKPGYLLGRPSSIQPVSF